MDLLGFQGADGNSSLAILGVSPCLVLAKYGFQWDLHVRHSTAVQALVSISAQFLSGFLEIRTYLQTFKIFAKLNLFYSFPMVVFSSFGMHLLC